MCIYMCVEVVSHLNNNLARSILGYFQIIHNRDKLKHNTKPLLFHRHFSSSYKSLRLKQI